MNKILSASQIRSADRHTIENRPIASKDLMLKAAESLFYWFESNFTNDTRVHIFCGPGNNGGDGFALAGLLSEADWEVFVYYNHEAKFSEDAQHYFESLNDNKLNQIPLSSGNLQFEFSEEDVIVDSIFGTGISRRVEGFYEELIQQINLLKNFTISVDIPSGLFSDFESQFDLGAVIQSNYTLSFEVAKIVFLMPEFESYVGRWEILPIGLDQEFIEGMPSEFFLNDHESVRKIYKPRKKHDHKGSFGHGFLIAGSYGKMGAAVLAAKAATKSGIGLISVHVPRFGYEIIQTCVPEAMASIDKYDKLISKIPGCDGYSAVAIGPGMGRSTYTANAIRDLLDRIQCPLVVDADAINILAENRELLDMLPHDTVLTPHYKEFERLVGPSDNHWHKIHKQIDFAKQYKVVVVLKGAYTSIVDPHGMCYFNFNGNPGLAKGGSGDILTGIILALLAQSYTPIEAARLGVYLHGKAADFAKDQYGMEAMTPSETLNMMGEAFDSFNFL